MTTIADIRARHAREMDWLKAREHALWVFDFVAAEIAWMGFNVLIEEPSFAGGIVRLRFNPDQLGRGGAAAIDICAFAEKQIRQVGVYARARYGKNDGMFLFMDPDQRDMEDLDDPGIDITTLEDAERVTIPDRVEGDRAARRRERSGQKQEADDIADVLSVATCAAIAQVRGDNARHALEALLELVLALDTASHDRDARLREGGE